MIGEACSAKCHCHGGYYGEACHLTYSEYNERITNRRKLFEASLTINHLYGDLERREGMKQRILSSQNQLMSVYELDSSISFQAIEPINSVMNQY